MDPVQLYDTTLRDGLGTPGLSLSVGERLKVVNALDDLGVQFIEAGFPGSNPKDAELLALLAGRGLKQATICAFGMTRRRGLRAADDSGLRQLVECGAPVLTLVGKTWGLHLDKVTKVSPDENLEMIAESVTFCRSQGKRVIFDAEHFFDAYDSDSAYALECVLAAVDAGAENVTLCDTNGGSLPNLVGTATAAAVASVAGRAEIGIHTHNDAECAVANSLVAVQEGARLVQGTLNGYGERCGNASLASVLPALQLKMGFEVVADDRLARLSNLCHYVAEVCNMTPEPAQPYVGWHAFTHKAGMHSAAVEVDPDTFEHVEPRLVGNQGESTPSELSGRGTIRSQAKRLGLAMDEEAISRALDMLKEREHRGYHYEAAPASFELLLRRAANRYRGLFELESFRVITLQRGEDGLAETEATIRINVDGERLVHWAIGNGPVNALDLAIRSAIGDRYPALGKIDLINYTVRILDEAHGTDAVTRVLIDSTDGQREWTTIGVAENVIEASWEALVDSLEYAFQPR
jgi:2-isopropylmalate synthase